MPASSPLFVLSLTDLAAPARAWPGTLAGVGAGAAVAEARVHQVLAGPVEPVLAAARAALAPGAGQPAGPVTVLAPLPEGDVLAELCRQGLSGWWPLSEADPPAVLDACLRADQSRWQRDHEGHQALLRAREQLDERRWVDRAKGVLMQSRSLSEDEAFRLLRGAAMSAGLRVGDVSRSVTEAAQWAEAVNRAGRLRMLSQRVIKLAAQRLDGVDPRRVRQAQGMAIGQVEESLSLLDGLPVMRASDPSSREALAGVQQAWQTLKPLLLQRLSLSVLAQSDDAAEQLLQRAEALTEVLEAGGARRALRLVNLCGRQRMRVQRLAKEAMLATLLQQPARAEALPALMDSFEATLLELERAPLGSPAARETLGSAREQWLNLLRGLRLAHGSEGRQALAVASDALLSLFDRLTADYEHSLQLILS